MARLTALAEQRKRDVNALTVKSYTVLDEISHIVSYIRENLRSIERLCEASIAQLVDLQVSRKKETELIEEIRTDFKERVRASLHKGPVTKEYIETMKETFDRLSKMVADRLRLDIFTLTGLYETLHAHAKKFGEELEKQIAGISKDTADLARDKEILAAIEDTLIRLLSDLKIELKFPAKPSEETEYESMLFEKRREMFEHIFSVLHEI